MFNVYLIAFLFFLTVLLLVILFFQHKKINALKYDISKIIIAVKRVRYGDINVHIEKLNDDELQNAINRLIETMHDREMMIKEYQSTLSKKNLSLEAIIKQEKQLRQIKEDIVATLTHDMKVPVVAELNSLNFLLEGRFGKLDEKQSEVLNLMKSSNLELKELIENILETYKMEQNELKLNLSDYHLNDFLKSVIEEMVPITSEKNIKIVDNFETTLNLGLSFDEFQIKRVLKNLIQNAVSFSPKSSEIIIKTDKDADKVKIFVTNTGSQISPEDINLIFNKYYTGQSKYRKMGTGLGLYLSKKIALAHNGDLTVESTKENSTTFVIELPIK